MPDHLGIDCYVAVLPKFRSQFPDARFEIIMRKPSYWLNPKPDPHILSPSLDLLAAYHRGISFAEYTVRFEREMFTNSDAITTMALLGDLSDHQLIFLVCVEKNPAECHRSLIKKYILHLDEYCAKWQLNANDGPLDTQSTKSESRSQ